MLAGLNLSVSERRYIAQRANLAIIAVKHFSWMALPLAGLVWLAMLGNNLGRGRWPFVRRDFRVLREVAGPAAGRLAFSSGECQL